MPCVGTHFALALSRIRFRGRIAKWVPKKEAPIKKQRLIGAREESVGARKEALDWDKEEALGW
jgi:hypothetical protein